MARHTPLGGSGPIPLLAGSARLGADVVALQDSAPAELLFRPGDIVQLRVLDTPPATYRLVVRSLPTVLGTVTVPASGDAIIAFTVPPSLAPHPHQLTLEDDDGVPALTTTLQVAPPFGCEPRDADADADGDGLVDSCDAITDDGPLADADGDGVTNAADLCPLAADSAQQDADGDGLGDACDPSQGGNPTAGYRSLPMPPATEPPTTDDGQAPHPSNTGSTVTPPSSGGGAPSIPEARPSLLVAPRQRLNRLQIAIRCGASSCNPVARARLVIRSGRHTKTLALPVVRRSLRAGAAATLRLKVPSKRRGTVTKALRRRRRVDLRVAVTVGAFVLRGTARVRR